MLVHYANGCLHLKDVTREEARRLRALAGVGYSYNNLPDNPELSFPPSVAVLRHLVHVEDANLTVEAADFMQTEMLAHVAAHESAGSRSVLEFEPRLYPYQRAGVRFLSRQKRALLADEVGLGKTIQALAAARVKGRNGRVLVLTKSSLITQWADEAAIWLPSWNVIPLPQSPERSVLLNAATKRFNKRTIIILNHDAITHLPAKILQRPWSVIIVDEAHAFKNRKARRSAQLLAMARCTDNMYLLTGTPQERSPADLWHLLALLRPDMYTSYWRFFNVFVDHFKIPGTNATKIKGPKNTNLLHDLLAPVYLRRTRADELRDLKEPQFIPLTIDPTGAEMKWAKLLEEESYIPDLELEIPNEAARMIYLREIGLGILPGAGPTVVDGGKGSKIAALKDLVEDNPDDRIVIFTSFRVAVDLIQEALGKQAVKYYSGGDKQVIQRFSQGKGPRVLVATTGSIGTGANLQVARVMIFADLPWSGTAYLQAVGRIVRIGQEGVPVVYSLVGKGTVDEAVAALIRRKTFSFDEVVVTRHVLEQRGQRSNGT